MNPRLRGGLVLALLALATVFLVVALVLLGLNGQLVTPGSLTVPAFFLFAPVGAVIALRRPEQPIGWLFCAIGVLYPLWSALEGYALYGLLTRPGAVAGAIWAGIIQIPIGITPWMLLIYSLMIFPTGSYLSRRWQITSRLVIGAFMLTIFLEPLTLATLDPIEWPNPLRITALAAVGDFLLVARNILGLTVVNIFAASLVVRFVRSRGEERKQLQLLAFAGVLWIPPSIASVVLSSLFDEPVIREILATFFNAIFSLALVGLAAAVGIAIWKYRLYDIDLIIRRTLVYSILTALLALTYWGGVAGLQALLRPITGEGNDLAIVATTLLVAGLFFPLRARIQAFIDRRFYRRKYDAARTLAQFGQVARDEVDLDALRGHLIQVVGDTMQPEHVSLWLAKE